MTCKKKLDMLTVSTRGYCCMRNVKNAVSRRLPYTALLRTTLSALLFKSRLSARPLLRLL
jgi:hypothetical protein